MKLGEGTRKIM